MGILLSALRGGGGGPETVPDLNLNIQNPSPTPEEAQVYETVVKALKPANGLLKSLRGYRGCGDEIRKAISSPTPETEQAAWQSLAPSVGKLKEFYEYSAVLEQNIPLLLTVLTKNDVSSNLEKYQALTKLLADILHFVFAFDDLKMTNPNVQNDFSYYRRTLSRMKMGRGGGDGGEGSGAILQDELANRMSLFYAYPTPMFRCVAEATATFVNKNSNVTQVSDCLSGIAGVCYNAVAKFRVTSAEDVAFCLRVMVASVVLFDHVHPAGAFVKGAPINVKATVRVVREHGGESTENLLNAIRFSTKHFADAPKGVKSALQ